MSLSSGPATGGRSYARPGATASDDYVEFCLFLRQLCGIDLLQYKRGQMERRLRSFYDQRGISDLRETFTRLRAEPAHLDELLDRITINVSQLWRNPEQWELLEKKLLPELASRGSIDAWSAGCSYGAEAYTLAALFLAAGAGTRFSGRIRGTDIDRRMVERAREGRFSVADARTAPKSQLTQAFDQLDDGWRAKPALRTMTAFEVGDLLKVKPAPQSFDLILCRNTVIYFQEPIRDELHARLAAALRPGGYLIVGSTERVAEAAALNLTTSLPFIYRKN